MILTLILIIRILIFFDKTCNDPLYCHGFGLCNFLKSKYSNINIFYKFGILPIFSGRVNGVILLCEEDISGRVDSVISMVD